MALSLPARADCPAPYWLSAPPSKVYKDGYLRLYFAPPVTDVPDVGIVFPDPPTYVVLEGDTSPTEFTISRAQANLVLIEDWRPTAGWGDRTKVGIPRQEYHPVLPDGGEVIRFDISADAPPPATAVTVKTIKADVDGECFATALQVEVSPATEGAIYWLTLDSLYGVEHMPFMLTGADTISVTLDPVPYCTTVNHCGAAFANHNCDKAQLTVHAEDLAKNKGPTSDPLVLDQTKLALCPTSGSGSGCGCGIVGSGTSGAGLAITFGVAVVLLLRRLGGRRKV